MKAVDFESVWKALREQCGRIVQLQPVPGMPMVEDVYRLCTAQPRSHSERLYGEFRAFLLEHVQQQAREMRDHDGDVLEDYRGRWRTFRTGMMYLHSVFRYLNNNWIRKTLDEGRNRLGGLFSDASGAGGGAGKDVHEISVLWLLLWREHVFEAVARERVTAAVIERVRLDRGGEAVDWEVCAQVVESIVAMGATNKNKPLELYKEHFERAYVTETRNYYQQESLSFISANGVAAYLRKAEARVAEEEERSKRFLDKSSLELLRREVDSVLIEAHREVLQVECGVYLDRATVAAGSSTEPADVSDVRRMYVLLSRVPDGLVPMLTVLHRFVVSYVSDKVAALGKKADQPEDYCEVLLAAYALFSVSIVEQAFGSSPRFVQTLDKAFREVTNRKADSPELMARFCDALLRKGKNKGSEGDTDGKLRALVTVFKYLDDKDVFQKFYSKYLARRLIHGTSASEDSEALVLSSLKQVCGFEYTAKLTRMFADVTQSEDSNAKFQQFLGGTGPTEGVSLTVLVLTQGSWPLAVHKGGFNAPRELVLCKEAFLKYYDSVHQGRRLAWLHHLGKADVRVNFLRKKYLVTVSDFQCALLLLFNDHDASLGWDDVVALSALPENDAEKTMASLVASKLVLRVTGDRDGPGACYEVNRSYANKHLKFKITAAVLGETDKEKKRTYKQVDDDRTMFLQALIVRVMKARKRLNHNALMQEVIAQASTRFQPSVALIKKQIEALMEKEFISRVDGVTADYQYIA